MTSAAAEQRVTQAAITPAAITPATWAVAATAGLSGLLIGYDTAVIAPALGFLTAEFGIGPAMQGIVVASVLLGGLVGSILAGAAARRWGRRPVLIATATLFLLAAPGAATAWRLELLLAWRIVLGLAVGAATTIAPLHVGETAPARWRGGLVSGIQLAITIGILLSYLAGTAFAPAGNWRAMFLIAALPAALMLAGLLLVPESPRWLWQHGRAEAAAIAWRRVAGDAPMPVIEAADPDSGGWRPLFGPRIRRALVLALALFAFANLSGIDAILYYAPTIFEQVGFGGSLGPLLATVGIGVVNVAATLWATWLIDRVGRRPLLLGGMLPMTLSLLVLAAALALDPASAWAQQVAVACLGVFVVGFAVSLGPLPYVVMAEIFPLPVRAAGMGLASATAWAVNVVVSATFLPLVGALGLAGAFGLYGAISAGAILFVLLMVPETNGRPLELIEANLARGCRMRDLGQLDPIHGPRPTGIGG
ncbi:MAG: sugar porter family MFS transporter [Rhodospirillales bacterium]|nr:sugar porter family MFS transporter [Rhodospirillales bacterium]